MVCFHSFLCEIFLDTSKAKKEEEGKKSKRSEEGKKS